MKKIIILIQKDFTLSIFLIIFIPMFIGGLSGLVINLNNISRWEELNYLYIFLPSLIFYFGKNLKEKDNLFSD